MRRDRPRYQVTLQLMPGSEPWMRVEANGAELCRLPAACSLLELWETLQGGRGKSTAPKGELMVRVPLEMVLSSPTVGAYRRARSRD